MCTYFPFCPLLCCINLGFDEAMETSAEKDRIYDVVRSLVSSYNRLQLIIVDIILLGRALHVVVCCVSLF